MNKASPREAAEGPLVLNLVLRDFKRQNHLFCQHPSPTEFMFALSASRAAAVVCGTRQRVVSKWAITFGQMPQKRESSATPGSAKRSKSASGATPKSAPSPKKEAVPVPDLEECGFVDEDLPQV